MGTALVFEVSAREQPDKCCQAVGGDDEQVVPGVESRAAQAMPPMLPGKAVGAERLELFSAPLAVGFGGAPGIGGGEPLGD
jgi:hypothetical protein